MTTHNTDDMYFDHNQKRQWDSYPDACLDWPLVQTYQWSLIMWVINHIDVPVEPQNMGVWLICDPNLVLRFLCTSVSWLEGQQTFMTTVFPPCQGWRKLLLAIGGRIRFQSQTDLPLHFQWHLPDLWSPQLHVCSTPHSEPSSSFDGSGCWEFSS